MKFNGTFLDKKGKLKNNKAIEKRRFAGTFKGDGKMQEFNTTKISFNKHTKTELINQIEALQRFYLDMGYNSNNMRTIFSLTLSYLKGKVNKLIIKTFFEVMMIDNKLSSNKEINLLNCFDSLIEELDEEEKLNNLSKLNNPKVMDQNSPNGDFSLKLA